MVVFVDFRFVARRRGRDRFEADQLFLSFLDLLVFVSSSFLVARPSFLLAVVTTVNLFNHDNNEKNYAASDYKKEKK